VRRDGNQTPVFMPVGMRATVRTQTLAQLGAPILLANTRLELIECRLFKTGNVVLRDRCR
jgi:queuine/archaeosine tRNA-ribosyltransferase